MSDPAAVLRAAADLAEQRARAATPGRWLAEDNTDEDEKIIVTELLWWDEDEDGNWVLPGKRYYGRQWIVQQFADSDGRYKADAEHIAAADPTFMLKRAEEWRRAEALYEHYHDSDSYEWVGELILEVALPSALIYLRQDQP